MSSMRSALKTACTLKIHQHRYNSDLNIHFHQHGPQVGEVLFVYCSPFPCPRPWRFQDDEECSLASFFTVLTLLCKTFLTPHFGPPTSKQGTDPLSPGSLTVSICNPAARPCHLAKGGGVQHATNRQLGYPLELPVRRN